MGVAGRADRPAGPAWSQRVDLRRIFNGILWILRPGLRGGTCRGGTGLGRASITGLIAGVGRICGIDWCVRANGNWKAEVKLTGASGVSTAA
jgi:hypothetical protein